MKKTKYNLAFFSVCFFILLIHYCIVNGLEKLTLSTFFDPECLTRPLSECKDVYIPTKCLGMPSGHVEIATILGCFLYVSKYISPIVLIGLIGGTCLQRILTQRHTFVQTIVGIVFGLFYASIYLSIQPYQCIVVCIMWIVLYLQILMWKIQEKLSKPIPVWVDPTMIRSINIKRNVPYSLKFLSILSCSFQQDRLMFMEWKELETYLDQVVDQIQKTNLPFDAVVGIKTGGAIISDYISYKLGIKNYKIKVSKDIHKCNKTPKDSIKHYINMYYSQNENENENENKYVICEGIEDDLSGKNVILIDENVSSGTTMNTSIDYLISKQVNMVYPTSIMSCINPTSHPFYKLNTILITDYMPAVWSWGYDN